MERELLRRDSRWLGASLSLLTLAGCGDDATSSETTATTFTVQEERNWFSGTSPYEWNSPDTVARLLIEVEEFFHGGLWIIVYDSRGKEILHKGFRTPDGILVLDGSFSDIVFTEDGDTGIWTILLKYEQFTGNIWLTFDAGLKP